MFRDGKISPKIGTLLHILLLSGLSLAVYANTLSNSFVYDDYAVVANNASVSRWTNFPLLFTPGYFRSFGEWSYRPVVTLSYFLDYALWQRKAAGYHLTNLLLHTLNGALVYFLIKFLFKRSTAALAAALLFVAHPVTAEAVNAVSYREDLLALGFGLLSYLSYLKTGSRTRRRAGFFVLCPLFFLLALFAKEMALVFPLLFLLSERGWGHTFSAIRKRRSVYGVLLLVLAFYCLVRFVLLPGPEIPGFKPAPVYLRMLMMSRTVFFYLKQLFFPLKLSGEYLHPLPVSFREPEVFFSLLGLSLVFLIGVFNFRRFPGIFFGIWWFLLALLPVANIVPLYNPVAERYLYLPLVGFCLALAVAGESVFLRLRPPAKYLPVVILFVLLGFYSIRTAARNRDWKDFLTFCRKTVETCPRSARAYLNLGSVCNAAGRTEEAVAAFEQAVRLDPDDPAAHTNLGVAYNNLGRKPEAVAAFRKALELNPAYALAHYNFGIIYYGEGKIEEAIASFRKTIDSEPAFSQAHNNLAVAYNAAGRYPEAVAAAEEALRMDPGYAAAFNNLGNAYRGLRKNDEAAGAYEHAIALDPNYADAYFNLGLLYAESGREEEAMAAYRRAVEIDPDHGPAHYRLALFYYAREEYGAAGRHCERALGSGYPVPPGFLQMLEFPPARQEEAGKLFDKNKAFW